MASKTVHIGFDFDHTLSMEWMEDPLLRSRGIYPQDFWNCVERIRDEKENGQMAFIDCLVEYIRKGPLAGLTKQELRNVGGQVSLYPGVTEFFRQLKSAYAGIDLQTHVISLGISEIIEGTPVYPYIDSLHAAKAVEGADGRIHSFEGVFSAADKGARFSSVHNGTSRVMYLGDGFSDKDGFRDAKEHGGLAIAVYAEKNPVLAEKLLKEGIVDKALVADYRPGSELYRTIDEFVKG